MNWRNAILIRAMVLSLCTHLDQQNDNSTGLTGLKEFVSMSKVVQLMGAMPLGDSMHVHNMFDSFQNMCGACKNTMKDTCCQNFVVNGIPTPELMNDFAENNMPGNKATSSKMKAMKAITLAISDLPVHEINQALNEHREGSRTFHTVLLHRPFCVQAVLENFPQTSLGSIGWLKAVTRQACTENRISTDAMDLINDVRRSWCRMRVGLETCHVQNDHDSDECMQKCNALASACCSWTGRQLNMQRCPKPTPLPRRS